jgi:hypothetical protein
MAIWYFILVFVFYLAFYFAICYLEFFDIWYCICYFNLSFGIFCGNLISFCRFGML